MTNKTVDPEMAAKLKERLETELIPGCRTRRSARAPPSRSPHRAGGPADRPRRGKLQDEWERLRDMTKDQPKALHLVETLKVAIDKYDDELREKSTEAEADESAMRHGPPA
jgi:hypothetical protein